MVLTFDVGLQCMHDHVIGGGLDFCYIILGGGQDFVI